MKPLLLLLAILLCIVRFFVDTHPVSFSGSYQAVAHLFVGGLLGAWLQSQAPELYWLAGVISLVEVFAAANGRVYWPLALLITILAGGGLWMIFEGFEAWWKLREVKDFAGE